MDDATPRPRGEQIFSELSEVLDLTLHRPDASAVRAVLGYLYGSARAPLGDVHLN